MPPSCPSSSLCLVCEVAVPHAFSRATPAEWPFSYQLPSPPSQVSNEDTLPWDASSTHRALGALMPRGGHTRLFGKQESLNISFRGPGETISPMRPQEAEEAPNTFPIRCCRPQGQSRGETTSISSSAQRRILSSPQPVLLPFSGYLGAQTSMLYWPPLLLKERRGGRKRS